jgi:hypothetical protein
MGASLSKTLNRLLRRERVVVNDRTHLYRWVLFRCSWFQVVIHNFLSDDPPDLHDHAWWNVSFVLAGALVETSLAPTPWGGRDAHSSRVLRPGDIVFRRAGALHRLTVVKPAWTLFITGPERREWGYEVDGQLVHWTRYNIRERIYKKMRTRAQ